MVTLMAGIILLAMGLTGLGSAVRFIPRPVVIGFTNGIAILIASTQIKDFFGLRVGAVPSEFLPRMKLLIGHMPSFNWQALAIGAATLAIMLILPRFTKRVPASIVALACLHRCMRAVSSAGGNHRHPLWRNPPRTPSLRHSRLPRRAHSAVDSVGIYRGAAGGA